MTLKKPLCSSINGLKEIFNICEDYAKDYNIFFIEKKCKSMYFGQNNIISMFNGIMIDYVEQRTNLKTKTKSDITRKNFNFTVACL